MSDEPEKVDEQKDGERTVLLTYPDSIRLVWRMPDGTDFDRLITPPPKSTIEVLRRSRDARRKERAERTAGAE